MRLWSRWLAALGGAATVLASWAPPAAAETNWAARYYGNRLTWGYTSYDFTVGSLGVIGNFPLGAGGGVGNANFGSALAGLNLDLFNWNTASTRFSLVSGGINLAGLNWLSLNSSGPPVAVSLAYLRVGPRLLFYPEFDDEGPLGFMSGATRNLGFSFNVGAGAFLDGSGPNGTTLRSPGIDLSVGLNYMPRHRPILDRRQKDLPDLATLVMASSLMAGPGTYLYLNQGRLTGDTNQVLLATASGLAIAGGAWWFISELTKGHDRGEDE